MGCAARHQQVPYLQHLKLRQPDQIARIARYVRAPNPQFRQILQIRDIRQGPINVGASQDERLQVDEDCREIDHVLHRNAQLCEGKVDVLDALHVAVLLKHCHNVPEFLVVHLPSTVIFLGDRERLGIDGSTTQFIHDQIDLVVVVVPESTYRQLVPHVGADLQSCAEGETSNLPLEGGQPLSP